MQDNKVNLFIIGQPKSGTTALYDYLKLHPDLFLPNQKQLYYFATDHNKERMQKSKFNKKYYRKYYNYAFDDYIKHFNNNGNYNYHCDITPDYFYSKTAAQEIFDYNPNAKIILLLREPLSFMKSFHIQMINSGYETELDFWKALDLESGRKQNEYLFNTACPRLYYNYSELTDYLAFLTPWQKLFGKNIKIIIYEDFKTHNFRVLSDIYKFLEVKNINHKEKIKSNISKQPSKSIIKKVIEIYPIRVLSSVIPKRIKLELKNKLISNNRLIEKSNSKDDNCQRDMELRKVLFNKVKEVEAFINTNNLALNGKKVDLLKEWYYV